MTKDIAIACSLGDSELTQRLAAIAEVGTAALICHESKGDRHLLRFHSTAVVRAQLEEIVAAEAECCSFLDLSLREKRDELVLSIAAPEDRRAVAEELAKAFSGTAA
jgi:hypothetical protein